jgi:hypothetical protein
MAKDILDLRFLCDVGKIGNVQDCENLNVKNDVEEILRGHIPPVTLLGIVNFWLRIPEASTMAPTRCHSIPQMTTIGVHRLEATMNTIPSFLLLPQHSYRRSVKHCNQRRQLMELSWKRCWKWDSMTGRHQPIHHISRDTNLLMARQNSLRMGLAIHHLRSPPRRAKHHSIIPLLRYRIESFQATLND